MRLGSKWIVGPAAGLVLLVGGIGVASAMAGDDPSARVTSPQSIRTDDRGHGADELAVDQGDRSGQDSAGDLSDDSSRRGAARRDEDHSREDDHIGGTPAQRAQAAAVAAVPGATVREVERTSGTQGATYHVELVKRDGTRMEVDLNTDFEPIKIERSGHDD